MNALAEPIARSPGLYPDLDIDAYHADTTAISKTGLDLIERSPAHYYAEYLDPARPPREDDETTARLVGHLAHCAILEPAEFDKRYAVGPDVSRATKAWKEFVASLPPGVTAIKPDQRETAMRQAESVHRLPDVREALDHGGPEVSAYWQDPTTGILCRCRPDWVHDAGPARAILVDVKTYSNATPHEFARQVARMRYHVQAAYYSDGFAKAAFVDVLAFLFLAVETEYPYAASVTMLDDDAMEQGRAEYHRNLETYAQCLKSGQWPGYSTAVETVSLPRWALTDVDIY
ncbi:MAG TPA: PD-(D/E)XK nuclease-like domain-containing protein [Castellaniella sp.]|uniref:PD-(D/E)XK nuclease-like domain-containing protein n=1 Tax=Castellaniella sp. TaxID=1955812 RepID=UPI002F14FADB